MSEIRVIPLGGLGEIGMNCLALEQRGEVLLIDCGVTFDNRHLGIDIIHPDFRALEAYRGRIVGIFLTHGHEDHIGALPYLLRHFDIPIWGPRYTLGLVRERAAEHEILDYVKLIEAHPRARYKVGSFVVEPIRVTHSTVDATALAITTDAGLVVHTGDFKFDEAPPDGEPSDVQRLEELGREGVSLLLSDSTNIDRDGVSGGELGVGEAIEPIVRGAHGAVVVGLFASNVHRLRMLGNIAASTGRKIVTFGRGVNTHARVARSTGHLHWPSDVVFPTDRTRDLPRRSLLGIATGTQAESRAALGRLARGEHPAFDLATGDTVIMSSRIIPGNDLEVFGLMTLLLRRGVEVRTWLSDRGIHVSGHAARDEQRRMLDLLRPKAFVPVHGTLHHLLRHAALAREAGVPSVCVLENGDVATLDPTSGLRRTSKVHAGRVHVFAGRTLAPTVLRERRALSEEGVAFAVVPVNARGELVGEIALATRGVLDETVDAHVLALTRHEVRDAVDELADADDGAIAEAARLAARRAFVRALGFKPMVVVKVQRVTS
ncbi:MAG: RNase J family beta-CASP ribonuclease [Myxococcales bacterium]|jgi:ribonuclease J